MRAELFRASLVLTIVAIALLGCGKTPTPTKTSEIIPIPTAVPSVAVLGYDDDAIINAYGSDELIGLPVYEMENADDLSVVNLSPNVTVYPDVIRGVIDHFDGVAVNEKSKGRRSFQSINRQSYLFTITPSNEKLAVTVVILPNNVLPPQRARKNDGKYPNAFSIKNKGKSSFLLEVKLMETRMTMRR